MTAIQYTAQTLEQVYYMARQHRIEKAIVYTVAVVVLLTAIVVVLAYVIDRDGHK